MRKNAPKSYCVIFGMLLLSFGCDMEGGAQIASPDNKGTPIWTIRAAVTAVPPQIAEEVDMADLRAAVVWGGLRQSNVSQSIPIGSTIPLEFDLDVFELPPQEVLTTKDEFGISGPFETWCKVQDPTDEDHPDDSLCDKFSYTSGMLVVYVDNNKNGTLDIVQTGEQTIDQVVGGAMNYYFAYIESDEPLVFPDYPEIKLGLNILRVDRDGMTPVDLTNEDERLSIILDNHPLYWSFSCDNHKNRFRHLSDYSVPEDITCTVVSPETAVARTGGIYVHERDGHCANERVFEWYDTNDEQEDRICKGPNDADYRMQASNISIAYVAEDAPLPDGWPCTGSPSSFFNTADDYIEGGFGDASDFNPECVAVIEEFYPRETWDN